MKIGFFGDSYVDLSWQFDETPRFYKPWSRRLVEDNRYQHVHSGVGGSSQFHALTNWNKFISSKDNEINLAIWTFTWENRIYHSNEARQEAFFSIAERRQIENIKNSLNQDDIDNLLLATKLYYTHIYSKEFGEYIHELLIEKILKLPELYPDIKFIFIPNTEFSRVLSQKCFNKGILLDFAFETLSNLEPESPGIMPINCTRVGHISDRNADLFKFEIENIIINFDKLCNSIVKIDYDKFDILK